MSEEYGNDFITLLDEDGAETEFEHIDTLEYEGSTYVALIPANQDPKDVIEYDGELVILKVVEDEKTKEEILVTIEDDDEYDEVADMFLERLEDSYEIES